MFKTLCSKRFSITHVFHIFYYFLFHRPVDGYDNYAFPIDEKPGSRGNRLPHDVDINDIYHPSRLDADDFSEIEYGEEPQNGFNEDGSFVGRYNRRDNPSPDMIDTSPDRYNSPPVYSSKAPVASHESLV